MFKKIKEILQELHKDSNFIPPIEYEIPQLEQEDTKKQYATIYKEKKEYKLNDKYITAFDQQKTAQAKSQDMAMDNNPAMFGNLYQTVYDTQLTKEYQFPGWGALILYQQVPLIYNACKVYADEIMRGGFELVSKDGSDKSELIKLLNNRIKEYEVKEILHKALLTAVSLGGCQIFTKLKNDENKQSKKIKYDATSITKGSLEYFTVIEPQWCSPVAVNFNKPKEKDFYKPELYTVMGEETHSSRMIKVIFNPVPTLIKPVYWFYGMSLTQKILQAVMDVEEVRNEIKEIIKRYNLCLVGLSPDALTDPVQAKARIQSFINGRDNFGAFIFAKGEEEVIQIQMALAGLDELFSRLIEFLCPVSEIPATKLLGQALRGFTTNDESSHRNWYDKTENNRESMAKPPLMSMLHMIMLNEGIEIDHDIDIKFGRLYEADKLELAQIDKFNSEAEKNRVEAGILSTSEVREVIANNEDNGYANLDTDNLDNIEIENNE